MNYNRNKSIQDVIAGKENSFGRKHSLNANPGVPVLGLTPNQLSEQYDPAAVFNMLLEPDYYARVLSLSGGRNIFVLPIVVERIRRKLWGATSMPRRATGRLGANTRYVMGEMMIQQPTASAATSGANIVLTWEDPSYSWFRQNDVLQNNTSTNAQGRVITPDFTAGTVTIAPMDDSVPLNLSDWNVVGQVVNVIGNAQPYHSYGRSPISQLPVPVVNYTQTFRETVQINRLDTYATYPKTSEGMPWVFAQKDLASMWLDKQIAISALYGQKGVYGANTSNPTRTFQGLDASIGDSVIGGVYDLMSAAPSADDFQDYWSTLANKREVDKSYMVHIVGRDYLTMIQNTFTNALVTPVGIYNTLERIDMAEIVQGLDAYSYGASGIRHVFIHEPALDDLGVSPNYSNLSGMTNYTLGSASCYTIDTGNFMDAQAKVSVPYMEQLYFDEMPFRIGVIRGLAKNPFFMENLRPELQAGMYEIATSQDNNTCEIMIDMGYNFTCPNMGCHKPKS